MIKLEPPHLHQNQIINFKNRNTLIINKLKRNKQRENIVMIDYQPFTLR